jgi:probable rRNA maturation factor
VAIEVVNRQRLARIDALRVASLADATLREIGKDGASLAVAFVRDRVIRELNSKFRGKDQATDVLSFPADDQPQSETGVHFIGSSESEHFGDIVVSTDAALRQANDAGHSFAREVDELLIHGVLHLGGYDHETDRGQMNRLELKLRRKLLGNDE